MIFGLIEDKADVFSFLLECFFDIIHPCMVVVDEQEPGLLWLRGTTLKVKETTLRRLVLAFNALK